VEASNRNSGNSGRNTKWIGNPGNKFSKNNIPEILEKDVPFFPGNFQKNYSNFSSNGKRLE